jgi:hypothetical protein
MIGFGLTYENQTEAYQVFLPSQKITFDTTIRGIGLESTYWFNFKVLLALISNGEATCLT